MSIILYLQIQHLYMHVRVCLGFFKARDYVYTHFLHCYSDIINISVFLYSVLNMMRLKKSVCLLQPSIRVGSRKSTQLRYFRNLTLQRRPWPRPFRLSKPSARRQRGRRGPLVPSALPSPRAPRPGRGRAAAPGVQHGRGEAKHLLPSLPSLPRPSLCGTVKLCFLRAGLSLGRS